MAFLENINFNTVFQKSTMVTLLFCLIVYYLQNVCYTKTLQNAFVASYFRLSGRICAVNQIKISLTSVMARISVYVSDG